MLASGKVDNYPNSTRIAKTCKFYEKFHYKKILFKKHKIFIWILYFNIQDIIDYLLWYNWLFTFIYTNTKSKSKSNFTITINSVVMSNNNHKKSIYVLQTSNKFLSPIKIDYWLDFFKLYWIETHIGKNWNKKCLECPII